MKRLAGECSCCCVVAMSAAKSGIMKGQVFWAKWPRWSMTRTPQRQKKMAHVVGLDWEVKKLGLIIGLRRSRPPAWRGVVVDLFASPLHSLQ